MEEKQFNKIRNGLLLAVILFEVCHLTWEYFNGGVITHHLFMRADLPGLSNWWGLLILPLLVWLSAAVIKKRISTGSDAKTLPPSVLLGFFSMLLVSTVQSIAFVNGFPSVTMYLALGVLVSALFVPLYRMECILGHVIGSTFVFGPAIPFVGVLMFAPISLLSHKCIKPLFLRFKNGRTAVS
ncbi:hypothetical protein Patl_1500 [Paraglaciecola sp. T6c]|uniref:hypothetical protein n=1 Tax=Pseudoalteromonas atlantica (strain T6c / ATCC BAA-1087) TaxID=3042615 RepID=UPI00005C6EE9|nr:hypothetical protein [Paraglaciecola sp. T6c]ABG40022.1 hypothetical protein Patl_1500 [Paraglaciecola sp. T6c]